MFDFYFQTLHLEKVGEKCKVKSFIGRNWQSVGSNLKVDVCSQTPILSTRSHIKRAAMAKNQAKNTKQAERYREWSTANDFDFSRAVAV